MSNDNVAPINHSAGSAAATTLSSTAGGALKTGAKSWLGAWSTVTAIGAGVGLLLGLSAIGVITFPVLSLSLPILGKSLFVAATTIGVGALAATTIAPWVATVFGIGGAAVGAGKGAMRGAEKVNQERGQAAELQAQVQIAKAQAPAYSPYAAQGSAMNPASTQINVGRDMQYDGPINGQLALAR
jgi:hypothetical protein